MKAVLFVFALISSLSACPFCDPAILEKQMVYEGKEAVVLYSLTPMTKGNVLVIPRRHIDRFDDLSSSELLEIHALIAKMSKAFQDVYGLTDYFILQKNGWLAGQSEPHTHFHVVPCAEHLLQLIASKKVLLPEKITDEEMQERCRELRAYWAQSSIGL